MVPTRRQILASGAALAGTVALQTRAIAAPRSASEKLLLTAGTRTIDVSGKPARVFGLTGPSNKPGITVTAGQRFRVDLVNQAGTPTIVHWHGQLPPWRQDGFPWPQTPPIPEGETHSYDYAPIPGTFWMHSHQGLQEQSLMAAPLIVHSAADLRDRQEVVLMLHDFSFRTPEELLARLMKSGDQRGMPKASMGRMDMSLGTMGSVGSGVPMDLNDVDYDAFLANDRTLADPEVIRVETGGMVLLRIINSSSMSAYHLDLGALNGELIAVDGFRVRPITGRRFPIAVKVQV